MAPLLAVGSTNEAKLLGVRRAARALWPEAEVVAAPPDPARPAQPVGFGAVRQGARRRALDAARAVPGALGLGLESGLVRRGGTWWVVGWVAVAVGGRVVGEAEPARFPLPPDLAARAEAAVASGGTLADAAAALWGEDAAAWSRRGTVAALTAGAVDRADLWAHAAALALGVARAAGRLPDADP